MTTETILTYEQRLRMVQDQYNGDPIEFARAIEQAVLQSPEIQALRNQDPLQPAANWLCETIAECRVANIQSALRIGYNRAQRLHTAAMEQQQ